MAALAFDVELMLQMAEADAAEPDMPETPKTREDWIKDAQACLTLSLRFDGRDANQTERLRQEYLSDALDCIRCAQEASR